MSAAPGDRAASLVRAWVRLYTGGLAAALADERRALIEADLWDEAAAADWMGETSGLSRQRVSRLVRGVPADISWRISVQRPWRLDMRIPLGQLVAIVAATLFQVFIIGALLTVTDFRDSAVALPATVGFIASIVGLLLSIPRPEAGFVIGALGLLLTFVCMWWMFPFYIPATVALLFRLLRATPSARTPTAPTPAPEA